MFPIAQLVPLVVISAFSIHFYIRAICTSVADVTRNCHGCYPKIGNLPIFSLTHASNNILQKVLQSFDIKLNPAAFLVYTG